MAIIIIIFAILVVLGLAGTFTFIGIKNYMEKSKELNTKISDKEVIEIARQNNGEISAVLLCEKTDLTLDEAQAKINRLMMTGIVHQKWDWNDWTGNKYKYILKDANKDFTSIEGKKSTNTTDADVISAAVQSKGKITPTALCLKLNISVDEAKRRLEDLRKKEIFEIDVTDNGAITYSLIDKDLLNP
jgi:predicted transcriptional regulator